MNYKNILVIITLIPSAVLPMFNGWGADVGANTADVGGKHIENAAQILVDGSQSTVKYTFGKVDSYATTAHNYTMGAGLVAIGIAGLSAASDYFYPSDEQKLRDLKIKTDLAVLSGRTNLTECLQKNSKRIIDENCNFSHCDQFVKNYTMAAGKSATDQVLKDFTAVYKKGE
jgi:hypothetical protein